LPLAAGELFDLPASPHLQGATAAFVSRRNFRFARNDLATTREVRPRDVLHQLGVLDLLVADHRHCRCGDFAQVVRRDFRGETHRDARGAVQQHEWQTRRQQLRLLERAIVVGHEVDRALVDFVQQQLGDRRQAGFGVPHGGRAVAVA
jgi:hypothetical protein